MQIDLPGMSGYSALAGLMQGSNQAGYLSQQMAAKQRELLIQQAAQALAAQKAQAEQQQAQDQLGFQKFSLNANLTAQQAQQARAEAAAQALEQLRQTGEMGRVTAEQTGAGQRTAAEQTGAGERNTATITGERRRQEDLIDANRRAAERGIEAQKAAEALKYGPGGYEEAADKRRVAGTIEANRPTIEAENARAAATNTTTQRGQDMTATQAGAALKEQERARTAQTVIEMGTAYRQSLQSLTDPSKGMAPTLQTLVGQPDDKGGLISNPQEAAEFLARKNTRAQYGQLYDAALDIWGAGKDTGKTKAK